jgi:hypothetical protein
MRRRRDEELDRVDGGQARWAGRGMNARPNGFGTRQAERQRNRQSRDARGGRKHRAACRDGLAKIDPIQA